MRGRDVRQKCMVKKIEKRNGKKNKRKVKEKNRSKKEKEKNIDFSCLISFDIRHEKRNKVTLSSTIIIHAIRCFTRTLIAL